MTHTIDYVALCWSQEADQGRCSEPLTPEELLQIDLLRKARLGSFKHALVAVFLSFDRAAAASTAEAAQGVLNVHHRRPQWLGRLTDHQVIYWSFLAIFRLLLVRLPCLVLFAVGGALAEQVACETRLEGVCREGREQPEEDIV